MVYRDAFYNSRFPRVWVIAAVATVCSESDAGLIVVSIISPEVIAASSHQRFSFAAFTLKCSPGYSIGSERRGVNG